MFGRAQCWFWSIGFLALLVRSSPGQLSPRVGPSGFWPLEEVPSNSDIGGTAAAGLDVGLGGTREPMIAMNPLDPQNVVMSSLFQSRASTDGGISWTAPLNNTVPAGYSRDGDPCVAFDSQGRWFYSYQGFHSSGGADEFVSQMDPVTGAKIVGPFKVSISGTTGAYNDKPWLAADRFPGSPFADRLYLVWAEFPTSGGTRILLSYSTNQGVDWSSPLQLSSGAEGFVWPPHITVAPNGDVYVSYHSQTGFFCNPDGVSGKVYVLRSTNGGVSFPQKNLAFAAGRADITYNVQDCFNGLISGAVFWTQGSTQAWVLADPQVPGMVYVVANDDSDNTHGSGDDADVYIVRSTNNGISWGSPIRVDHGPGTTFQVMPAAAIDDSSGCIGVVWYDNRNGAVNASGHYLLDVYYSISSDQGLTWSPDVMLNDVPFDPDRGAPSRYPGPPPTLRIGEYIGAAFHAGTIQIVWTGNLSFSHQAITDSVVDACAEIAPAPIADATGIDKVRFVSLSTAADLTLPIRQTAIRVKLNSLHHPNPPYTGGLVADFSAFEGQVRWVGPPLQYPESAANPTLFYASSLQCTPDYRDWSTVGLLHVTGSEIVPSSMYNVQLIISGAQTGDEGNYSLPLQVSTNRWGDVEIPYNPPDPSTQPDLADVSALVNKFRSAPGAPIKARALLAGDDAFGNISSSSLSLDYSFSHIAACVDAFRGKPYPHTIQACP